MGFALWLVPAEDEVAALTRLQEFRPRNYRYSRHSRSYPRFTPHITLATFTTPGFVDLNVHELVPDDIHPVTALFESIKEGNTYLGSLGVNIVKTRELLAMGQRIANHLLLNEIEPKQRGFPHMSLFYVDEPEERQLLQRELKATGRVQTVRQGDGTVALLHHDPSNRRLSAMSSFFGDQIWLMDCNSKDPNAWYLLDKMWLRPSGSRRNSTPSSRFASPVDPPPVVPVNYASRPPIYSEPQYAPSPQAQFHQSYSYPADDHHYEFREERRQFIGGDGFPSSRTPAGNYQSHRYDEAAYNDDHRNDQYWAPPALPWLQPYAWYDWLRGVFVVLYH